MSEGRSPGRPRSEASRQATLVAALGLAADVGYGRLTIEGIAARAGVGKQTIYRWWPSKADILLEAGAVKADLHVPVTDHGSYRADLRAFLEASYQMRSHPGLADLLRALMAEAQLTRSSATASAPPSWSAAGKRSASSPTAHASKATCRPGPPPAPSPTSCSAPSGTGRWQPASP